MPYNQAGSQVDSALNGMTAGCNPAHRAAPPVLVGSIGGARWGAGQISDQMLSHHTVEFRRRLTAVASGLAAGWNPNTL